MMAKHRRPIAISPTLPIASLGEVAFLERLLPHLPQRPDVCVGPGDDCAVVRAGREHWLITTDALVEDVHFRREWMTPEDLARKAYRVNLSDIAAMGGVPRYCVASVAVPATHLAGDLYRFHIALSREASASGATLVGGNLSCAERIFISLTLVGMTPRQPLLRSGARPGDAIYVTGHLGDAAVGLRQLKRDPRARGAGPQRFRRPPVRLRAGLALATASLASSMIDVSDGLLQDLGHLCRSSDVGAEIRLESVPCSRLLRQAEIRLALTGGEDYELLFTVPRRKEPRLAELRRTLGCPVTRIGEIVEKGYGVGVVNSKGQPVTVRFPGFDHFQLRGEE